MKFSQRSILFVFLFSTIFGMSLKAQYYSTGQDPASAKWSQIKTDNFQIIFQRQFIDKAQKVANLLESNYLKASKTLEHKPKKISVILHNQTVNSNGYVSWAPKRSEFYTTPPQDVNPDQWLNMLCVHEFRHVVQVDKLNQGITKVLSIVFGQQATGVMVGQLPMWFIEGDAVCAETALLNFGRGRLPFFERGTKAHLLSDEERYSFDKMLFGSYHDYVPDHYELGYQLTSYARYKYGSSIWSNVENYVARNSYTLLPTSYAFYKGLKKNIGLSQKELFNEAYNYLDSSWSVENDKKEYNKPKYFQTYNIEEFENYINPTVIDEETVLALKKGLSHIPNFVIVKHNTEKVIYEPGHLISNDFSYSNYDVVWAEYRPDRRWANREYTTIKTLNIKMLKTKVLVKKARYFSPEFSPKADKIVVVEVDEQNNSSLVILEAFTGSVINEIESNDNCFIQRPQWSESGKYIYAIEQTNKGKQVSRYNLGTNNWEHVFKLEGGDIQRIRPANDYVYFHSTYNGTDNVYVYDEKSRETFQISESQYGISDFDISANGNNLISNEYTSQGFRIAEIPIERALWKNIDRIQNYKYKMAEVLTEQESDSMPIDNESQTEFTVKPYRKSFNLFNLHSWFPFYMDFNQMLYGNAFSDPSIISENIHPGITLLSQNKLSTVETIFSYAYKDENHFLSSSLVLKGQYPVVKLSANYGNDQLIHATNDAAWSPEINAGYSFEIEVYVPFNFSSGKYIRGLRPMVSFEYYNDLYYNYRNDYYIKGFETVQTGLMFYSFKRKAEKDIIPKLGVVFDINTFNVPMEIKINDKSYNIPLDNELFGYLYSADVLLYLPGGKNKGVKIDFGYQYQDVVQYYLSSQFRFPRGVQKAATDQLIKLYGDYVFPIAYPDWNLGSLLYLKRFRGSVFLDYAYNSTKQFEYNFDEFTWKNTDILSCGFELTADYHLLRTIFPLNSGIRVGYIPTEKRMFLNFVFGIDLNNL